MGLWLWNPSLAYVACVSMVILYYQCWWPMRVLVVWDNIKKRDGAPFQFVTTPLSPSHIIHAYHMKFHVLSLNCSKKDANTFPLLKGSYGMLTLKYTDLPLNEPWVLGTWRMFTMWNSKSWSAFSQEDWLYNLPWTAQHLFYNMEYYLCLTYTHPFSTLNLPITYIHNAM